MKKLHFSNKQKKFGETHLHLKKKHAQTKLKMAKQLKSENQINSKWSKFQPVYTIFFFVRIIMPLMPFSWWILGVHLGLSSRSEFMTSSLFTLRWCFCLSTCHMVLHPNSCPGPRTSSLIALITVVLEPKYFLRFKPALLSLLLRVLKLIWTPRKLDIMSKITLYEWPSLK